MKFISLPMHIGCAYFLYVLYSLWLQAFVGVCGRLCKMAPRNEAREAAVKALNKIALDFDISGISNNAGKQKVDGLLASLRDYVTGNGAAKRELDQAVAAYAKTWLTVGAADSEKTDGATQAPEAGDAEEHEHGATEGRGYL